MKTVILEFSVDGIAMIDNTFEADTDMTPDEWHALSDDEQEAEAKILYNENIQWGWRAKDE